MIKRIVVITGDVSLSELKSVRYDEWKDLDTISTLDSFDLKYEGNKYRVFLSQKKLADFKDVSEWLANRVLIQEFKKSSWVNV